MLNTCVGVDHDAAVTGQLDATDALVVSGGRKIGHRIPFGRGVHQQQFPVVIALRKHRIQQLTQVDPIGLIARHHNAQERPVGECRGSGALARQVARLCALLLKPTAIGSLVRARILHAVPAVVDHTVVQAAIHGAKTALNLACRISCNRNKISNVFRHFHAQIRFIDAASVLLWHVDLRLKHMHGGIDGIHMRIEYLKLGRALGVSRPCDLVAPHSARIGRKITDGINLVATAALAALCIADERTQRRLCLVVNLGFQLSHTAIEANGSKLLATGRKVDVDRRAIQKRQH